MTFAAIFAENAWWVCVVICLVVRMPHQRRARHMQVKIDRRDWFDWAKLRCVELGFGVLPFAYILFKFPGFANYRFFEPFAVIGPLVFLTGIFVIHRAHRDLGLSFSGHLRIYDSHRLVTTGIYRYVRHPIYVGALLAAIAQALLLPNWVAGFSALVAWYVLFATRLRHEEAMMIGIFGDEYRAYMTRTARFIPGIY